MATEKQVSLKQILEDLDSTIAKAIDDLDTHIIFGEHLTDEEFDVIQDQIDALEDIRGVLNED